MTERGGIWIQGAGEMASAVAVRLVTAGCRVLMAEIARPLAVRRLVAFSEAVYDGTSTVSGVTGSLAPAADAVWSAEGEVTVIVDPEAAQLLRVRPVAVIDARLTKRAPVPLPAAGVPRVGLGPGFVCGRDVDLVVETHREAGPGRVIDRGSAAPDTGAPGALCGHTTARVLRSPAAGRLRPLCRIGDLVRAGQTVGEVAGLPVVASLDGRLRGLIHEQAELSAGMKVGDVDPRGAACDPRAVSDKGMAIGDGVLRALVRLGVVAGGGRVAD